MSKGIALHHSGWEWAIWADRETTYSPIRRGISVDPPTPRYDPATSRAQVSELATVYPDFRCLEFLSRWPRIRGKHSRQPPKAAFPPLRQFLRFHRLSVIARSNLRHRTFFTPSRPSAPTEARPRCWHNPGRDLPQRITARNALWLARKTQRSALSSKWIGQIYCS